MSSVVGRVLVIAVIVGGGVLLRGYLSGSPGDLRVGDCFDLPAEEEIDQVQHHPCDTSHTAEVFAVFNHTGPRDASYPGEAEFDDVAFTTCIREFAAYTGVNLEEQFELDTGYLYPTPDGWTEGDRTITCALVRLDGAPLTRSMRAATR